MKKKKGHPAPVMEPKPQIPAMLSALRRQREQARTLVAALATKLTPVMRPAEDKPEPAQTPITGAAPVADALYETIGIFAALNAQLREIAARVEL